MSLFSKKPKSIADFEKEIEKLRHKKKLSARNSERLEEYEKQLSSLKTAEEAAQKKKARQKKIAIGSIAASVALITCIIIAGCISERGTVEPPTVSPGYTISDSSAGMTTPSDTSLDTPSSSETSESPATSNATTPAKESNSSFSISEIPAYSGSPYVVINNNIPYFTESDYTTNSYEYYSELDSLGRCGVCVASIGKDLMPTEERGSIGSVKPTGWHTVKYDNVDGKYLYNRCHLIGYQLSGENANTKNLITGTRYLNIQGMLPFENMVADYVKETGNHILYRSTPIFEGNNLLASGVLLEAYSGEDNGDGICFNVYCYNVQPDISINYATGDSSFAGTQQTKPPKQTEQSNPPAQNVESTYILNVNTKKFHYPSCSSVKQMSDKNKQTYTGSRDDLISQGYDPCKIGNPLSKKAPPSLIKSEPVAFFVSSSVLRIRGFRSDLRCTGLPDSYHRSFPQRYKRYRFRLFGQYRCGRIVHPADPTNPCYPNQRK